MTKYDDAVPRNLAEWQQIFTSEDPKVLAQLTGQLMIAVGFYHQRMRFHIMLHPLFFLIGFLTAYGLL